MRAVKLLPLAFASCLGFPVMALADEAFTGIAPVEESTLDTVRGGLEIPGNLLASIRLERAAWLNGELIASLSVDIPDVAHMSAAQAEALREAAGTLVIQNGPANAFSVSDLGPASTVIQNTLSDTQLTSLTTISVGVNTLGVMRDLNFQDSLRDSLVALPGVR